jgi:hypothetical protein
MTRRRQGRDSGNGGMTRHEIEDAQRYLRQHEKAQLALADYIEAEKLARFEKHLASKYSFDSSAKWAAIYRDLQDRVGKLNAEIAKDWYREHGTPKEFAPSIPIGWFERGENDAKKRREELRRAAQAQAAADKRKAILEYKAKNLDAQRYLAIAGATTGEARRFIESVPPLANLIPELDFEAITGESITDQLTKPKRRNQQRRLPPPKAEGEA